MKITRRQLRKIISEVALIHEQEDPYGETDLTQEVEHGYTMGMSEILDEFKAIKFPTKVDKVPSPLAGWISWELTTATDDPNKTFIFKFNFQGSGSTDNLPLIDGDVRSKMEYKRANLGLARGKGRGYGVYDLINHSYAADILQPDRIDYGGDTFDDSDENTWAGRVRDGINTNTEVLHALKALEPAVKQSLIDYLQEINSTYQNLKDDIEMHKGTTLRHSERFEDEVRGGNENYPSSEKFQFSLQEDELGRPLSRAAKELFSNELGNIDNELKSLETYSKQVTHDNVLDASPLYGKLAKLTDRGKVSSAYGEYDMASIKMALKYTIID